MNREERIMKRVQEHYDYLQSLGYEVVCVCLQGSQNYGLDEYSDEYMSDIDTKAIVLPPLDDFIAASPPVSKVVIMDNNEHAEVKDIRVMFEMFKKMNISYIELLYSDYIIINPKWADLIAPLFSNKDLISSYSRTQFIKCIYGMALEKRKALCHPYPTIKDKIDKYGYDGKQLHHIARLYEFLTRFNNGESIENCFKSNNREELMMYKKQMNADGSVLSAEDAVKIADELVFRITALKDYMIDHYHIKVKSTAIKILDEIKYNIIKEMLRRELNEKS